ncbi:hypothetical protein [Roseateles sp.]|uniref:hypothetical protein n=1 Tax=Roseateles sp. TaxID=1971397 RepID=UPI003D126BA1
MSNHPVGKLFCLLVFCFALLAGCSTAPRMVDHSFKFDTVDDSPGFHVLDYRYGTSGTTGTSMPDWVKRTKGYSQSTSTHGGMPLGETLYVKWISLETGRVWEETVSLKGRLPQEMTGRILYFVVGEATLHVYVVERQLRSADEPSIGPQKYNSYKVTAIYSVKK